MACNENNEIFKNYIKNSICDIGINEPKIFVETVCIIILFSM